MQSPFVLRSENRSVDIAFPGWWNPTDRSRTFTRYSNTGPRPQRMCPVFVDIAFYRDGGTPLPVIEGRMNPHERYSTNYNNSDRDIESESVISVYWGCDFEWRSIIVDTRMSECDFLEHLDASRAMNTLS